MKQALEQARVGRLHILGEMSKAIDTNRAEMSAYAPRITTITVPVDKIGTVIGPSGKMIKQIIAETGCKVDISDDGRVNVASNDAEAAKKAIDWIRGLVESVEVGKVYQGVVKKIVDFGAFVGVLPNTDGLLHVSEIAHERVNHAGDFFKEGDTVEVKVVDVDNNGKIRLSRKVLLPVPEGYTPEAGGGGGGGRGDRGGDRGGRGGDRGGDRAPRAPRPEDRGATAPSPAGQSKAIKIPGLKPAAPGAEE
jgi:polyribonucleotide nucleotidyltransferase